MEGCPEVWCSYECVAELHAVDVRGRVNIVETRRRASGRVRRRAYGGRGTVRFPTLAARRKDE